MDICTVPPVTLDIINIRSFGAVVPTDVKAPLVADPVPGVIVMSDATNPAGTDQISTKRRVMDGVGLPSVGIAVQAMLVGGAAAVKVTMRSVISIPAMLMPTHTIPADTLDIANVRVLPEPVKVPLVAAPPAGEIVMSDAVNPTGLALKVKLIALVGFPEGLALQVITGAAATSVTVCGALAIPSLLMEIDTVPALTLETAKSRQFPLPVKAPLVAEPVMGVIVMSDASNVATEALKSISIRVVVGEPAALAVHVILAGGAAGATSVIVCGPLAIPSLLIEMDTVPADMLDIAKVRVFPVPVKAPLVAEPVPGLIVMSVASSPVGAPWKLKVMDGVGVPDAGLAVQVIAGGGAAAATSVIVCGPLAIPSLLMEMDTVPALTLETAKSRQFPLPVKAPLVADPVIGVIVMSDASNVATEALKSISIRVVVGEPAALAVQVISAGGGNTAAISITVLGSLAIPSLFIETDTVPALTLETDNARVVPLPVKFPLVAEPVRELMVMSDAANAPGSALNVKLIFVVVGLPAGVATQVISGTSSTMTTSAKLHTTSFPGTLTISMLVKIMSEFSPTSSVVRRAAAQRGSPAHGCGPACMVKFLVMVKG